MQHYPWTCWTREGRPQVGRLSLVSAPSGDVISLADAKLHLRVDHDDEDGLIAELVQAAADEVDSPRGWLGRSLLTRTLRLTLDHMPPRVVYLPGVPVQSIVSIQYRNRNGDMQTLDDSEYETDITAEPGLVWPVHGGQLCGGRWPDDMQWHGPDVFRVEYIAGYATADDVPKIIKRWMLTRVGDLYRDREGTIIGTSTAPLMHVERALDNLRVR